MVNRRRLLLSLGATAATGAMAQQSALAQAYATSTRGLPPLKITEVKVILTNPPVTRVRPDFKHGHGW